MKTKSNCKSTRTFMSRNLRLQISLSTNFHKQQETHHFIDFISSISSKVQDMDD